MAPASAAGAARGAEPMTTGNAEGLADDDGDADGVGESAGVLVAEGPSEAGGTQVAIGVGLGDAPGVELGEWLGIAAGVPHAATTMATTAAATKPRVRNAAPPLRDRLLRLILDPLIFDPLIFDTLSFAMPMTAW
jgi:hypothetical protein